MSPAMANAMAKIATTARQTAFHRVKARARHYRSHRLEMGVLHRALPFAHPRQAVAIGEALVEEASARRSGRLVQLAPVSLANARAVLLLGRYERRFSARLQEAA